MSKVGTRNPRPRRAVTTLHKPHGVIYARVQEAGPEHFGLVSVDCAKARFKWKLCDFYGKVLVTPTVVEHHRVALDAMRAQLQKARQDHELRDLIVAVERTGRFHRVPQSAFATVCSDVRIVHPYTTKQFRQATDPGIKTDDTDLGAIHRAAVNGCALREASVDPLYRELQLIIRHRRDWVRKASMLCCQIRDHLEVAYPGYVACFADPWRSAVMTALVRQYESAAAMAAAGINEMAQCLRQKSIRFQQPALANLLAWARHAPPSDTTALCHRRIALALNDDRTQKAREIRDMERIIAHRLVQTPYVLLLSFPGINVVSAGDFAGEMGPIENYRNAKAITGRAGLYPSRYQSDEVDRPHGPLVRCANRALRAAILSVADNLIGCNHHFRQLSTRWKAAGDDVRLNHVRVACRFSRIAFQIVAGRQVFRHPSLQQRHYILDKLNVFHREHETGMQLVMTDLLAAIGMIPRSAHADEARPLIEQHQRLVAGRHRGPQLLGDILPIVLARLGVGTIQSNASGEEISAPPEPATEPRTPKNR